MASTRERILAAAGTLFYRDGVRAVGVNTVVAESGVAKMTLYKHFRSKDELVAAWLRSRDEQWMAWLEREVRRTGGDPLLAVFDALESWFRQSDFRGCAFVNTQAELGATNPLAAEAIAAHKRALREYLAGLAATQGIRDAAGLARELLLLVEGAIVTASIDGDPRVARVARRAAERAVGAYR